MRLTPTERDRLLLFGAAELARARRGRGLRLNVPEATALIADTVCEAARDGVRLAEAVERARSVLGPDDVLPGVADVVTEVHVEAVFDDGSRLAIVSDPIGGGLGDAGPGALLPGPAHADPAPVVRLTVTNTATVPVSVTSHFHFFEANPRLDFERAAAYGMRLAVPAGSSVRFGPGESAEVGLVPIGGARVVIGFAGLVDGPLDAPGAREEALRRAAACGYTGAQGVADEGLRPGEGKGEGLGSVARHEVSAVRYGVPGSGGGDEVRVPGAGGGDEVSGPGAGDEMAPAAAAAAAAAGAGAGAGGGDEVRVPGVGGGDEVSGPGAGDEMAPAAAATGAGAEVRVPGVGGEGSVSVAAAGDEVPDPAAAAAAGDHGPDPVAAARGDAPNPLAAARDDVPYPLAAARGIVTDAPAADPDAIPGVGTPGLAPHPGEPDATVSLGQEGDR